MSVRETRAGTEADVRICVQTTPVNVPGNTWGETVSTVSENHNFITSCHENSTLKYSEWNKVEKLRDDV